MSTDPGREPDGEKLARLRELLPATGAGIYLDTATFGPLPAETAAAMRQADDWELKVGRATVGRDEDMAQRIEEAQAVLAALLVADPSEIVLAPGVDAAIELARRIAGTSEPAVLDASLMVGALPLEAAAAGVDFVAFACDRWLLGPEQTAALWINPRATRKPPASSGLARTSVLGLARSVGWLEMYVGLTWIYERTAKLAGQLRESLSRIPALTLAPPEQPAIVDFRIERWPLGETLDELRRRVFAIVGSSPDGESVRASVGWFNTEDELETFVRGVAEIAANTPDSIPRRLPLLGQ